MALTAPKPFQVVPSVEYCQAPLPVLLVTAIPLSALVSTSAQAAVVSNALTVVPAVVVFSLVAVRVTVAPVPTCCAPTLAKVPGAFWLLYVVATHPAERATLDMRTSSSSPSSTSVPPVRPPM